MIHLPFIMTMFTNFSCGLDTAWLSSSGGNKASWETRGLAGFQLKFIVCVLCTTSERSLDCVCCALGVFFPLLPTLACLFDQKRQVGFAFWQGCGVCRACSVREFIRSDLMRRIVRFSLKHARDRMRSSTLSGCLRVEVRNRRRTYRLQLELSCCGHYYRLFSEAAAVSIIGGGWMQAERSTGRGCLKSSWHTPVAGVMRLWLESRKKCEHYHLLED